MALTKLDLCTKLHDMVVNASRIVPVSESLIINPKGCSKSVLYVAIECCLQEKCPVAFKERVKIVQLLLDAGVDTNSTSLGNLKVYTLIENEREKCFESSDVD